MKRTIAKIELRNVLVEPGGLIAPAYVMQDAQGAPIGGVTTAPGDFGWSPKARDLARQLLNALQAELTQEFLTEK
jgi:hypothetical protein